MLRSSGEDILLTALAGCFLLLCGLPGLGLDYFLFFSDVFLTALSPSESTESLAHRRAYLGELSSSEEYQDYEYNEANLQRSRSKHLPCLLLHKLHLKNHALRPA